MGFKKYFNMQFDLSKTWMKGLKCKSMFIKAPLMVNVGQIRVKRLDGVK